MGERDLGQGLLRVNRAVFLDRDGVINRAIVRGGRPYPPLTVDEMEFLPGVAEATAILSNAGFRLIVVTNQPDVATGVQRLEVVEAMHARLRREFPIDDIRVCYHVDRDGCMCRKPKPGMLLDAAAEWSIDLTSSFMVGDRWRDIGAGKAAGCKTIRVGDGYAEAQAETPDSVVESLRAASLLIVAGRV